MRLFATKKRNASYLNLPLQCRTGDKTENKNNWRPKRTPVTGVRLVCSRILIKLNCLWNNFYIKQCVPRKPRIIQRKIVGSIYIWTRHYYISPTPAAWNRTDNLFRPKYRIRFHVAAVTDGYKQRPVQWVSENPAGSIKPRAGTIVSK